MRVPSNIIKENKYTLGKELVYAKTYKEYQGYYYEISDKLFAGREFDPKALQLTKISSISKVKLNEKTSIYSNLTKQNQSLTDRIISIPLSIKSEIKYIVKQLNSSPIRLFFIDKETYEREKNNPLYSFTTIYFDSQYGFSITEQNKKEIPEINIFLEEYSNV
jgi:hypothetical protein